MGKQDDDDDSQDDDKEVEDEEVRMKGSWVKTWQMSQNQPTKLIFPAVGQNKAVIF